MDIALGLHGSAGIGATAGIGIAAAPPDANAGAQGSLVAAGGEAAVFVCHGLEVFCKKKHTTL